MDLITTRLNFKQALEQNKVSATFASVKAWLDQYGIHEDDAEFVRKGVTTEDTEFVDGERASWDYITTDVKDRDSEIVLPSGGKFTDYMKHPVVLFGHNYFMLPIGKTGKIVQDKKGTKAKTIYYDKGLADEVWQYKRAGFPLAKSIGFVPLAWQDHTPESKEGKAGVRRTFTEWLLLEHSDVAVPSNPEALTIAVSKGIIPVTNFEGFDLSGRFTVQDKDGAFVHFDEDITGDDLRKYFIFSGTEGVAEDYDAFLKSHQHEVISQAPAKETEEQLIKMLKEKTNILGIEINEDELIEDQEKLDSLFLEIFPPENCPHLYENEYGQRLINQRITKPGWDETEDMYRCRIKDPGLFRDGTMRTVDIKKDKPRVKSVMGKLKANDGKEDDPMTTQNVMFPKEDWDSMDAAKAWLKEHDDLLKFFEMSFAMLKNTGGPVLKRPDVAGNPSAWDIMDSLQILFRSPVGMYSNRWVCDVYLVNYPNGHCIVQVESADGVKYYQYDYTYADGKAELSSEFVELEQGYKPKGFLLKEGRVLSEKNRSLIRGCNEQLRKTAEMLQELLDATEREREDGKTAEPEKDVEKMKLETAVDKAMSILGTIKAKERADGIVEAKYAEMRKRGIVQV